MAEICRFNGIRILMYEGQSEHPPPHFHAVCGDDEAMICVFTGLVLEGGLRSSQFKLVRLWWSKHRKALEENWQTARKDGKVNKLPPL